MARLRVGDTWRTYRTDKTVYVEGLRWLHQHCPDCFERLRKRIQTYARTFVAHTPEDLFIASPHLAEKPSHYCEIVPGWFVDTNVSNKTKQLNLIEACAIAGVSYAYEMEVEFNIGHKQALSRANIEALWSELNEL